MATVGVKGSSANEHKIKASIVYTRLQLVPPFYS